VLDRIGRIIARARALREPPPPIERVENLEKRVTHLETMIEGLQDAVHREITRTNSQIDRLRKRTEPGELSRALSEDARHRGL
jgi:ABC-type phosphate transport system auxiliary subunit